MPTDDADTALAGAVRALVEVAGGSTPGAFLAAVVDALIDRDERPVDRSALRLLAAHRAPHDPAVAAAVHRLAPGIPAEDLVGPLHEAVLALEHRHARGVYYTPVDVAAHVVGLLGDDWPGSPDGPPPAICDPAAGGGAFLLAAGRALEARGWSRRAIVEEGLWGVDLDPVAVAVTEAALVLWAAASGEQVERANVVEADALLCGRERLAGMGAPVAGFDAVVGNPPFQSQLGTSTARDADMLARVQARFGKELAWRYTDTAALFLLESCRLLRPGGRAALVLPQSVLVSGDARPVRRAVLDLGDVEHLWVAHEPVFSATVRVCAPVIRRHPSDGRPSASRTVSRRRGRTFTDAGPVEVDVDALRAASTWGALTGDLFGAPVVDIAERSADTLGSFCRATAGFRDQYYGLEPYVREATAVEVADAARPVEDRPPLVGVALLVTCGLIDPARCRWGTQATKFARRRWVAPVVDLEALAAGDPVLSAWTADRLVPKVVVSTQTRVLEAAVDPRGDWYPSVPTIALSPPPDRLWHAAAAVMAPSVTAWLFGRHAGAALSHDAIKVSARQLLDVPLPHDQDAWDAAIDPLRVASAATDGEVWHAAMARFGACMHEAYGGDDDVLRWWLGRLPAWR